MRNIFIERPSEIDRQATDDDQTYNQLMHAAVDALCRFDLCDPSCATAPPGARPADDRHPETPRS
jgi:hypothetical protein